MIPDAWVMAVMNAAVKLSAERMVASLGDAKAYRCARQTYVRAVAAWAEAGGYRAPSTEALFDRWAGVMERLAKS